MSSNEYHFITHWHILGTVEEIYAVLGDAPALARWWPAVYLDVQVLEPGGENGVGKVIDLYTKGWLPYTLRWKFTVGESRPPHTFTLEASGDFVGRGVWTLEQAGAWVNVTYDWKIRAEKPLLRNLSFLMKPVFAFNHRWAMTKGEESLKLELARRAAATPAARALVPPPPPPTPTSPVPWVAGTVGVAGLAYWLWTRLPRSLRWPLLTLAGAGLVVYLYRQRQAPDEL